jgi:DNA glycosylase AlkZ-like
MAGPESSDFELSAMQVRALRTSGQWLRTPATRGALVRVVRSVYGINAQSTPSMMLSLRARVAGLVPADVEKALGEERALTRTWSMRGTIHLMDPGDASWFVSRFGQAFIARSTGRLNELGLDRETLSRGAREILDILGGGAVLTRGEIADALHERGFEIDSTGQALIHLIRYTALEGLVVLGPERANGKSTYLSAGGENAERRSSTASDLATLIERYLAGFGPASAADFASWSGLRLTDTKRAWSSLEVEGKLREVSAAGYRLWMLQSQVDRVDEAYSGTHVVRLLPAFDAYLLGYRDRDLVVPPERRGDIFHGGQTVPVVIVDGSAKGVWRYERKGRRLSIGVRAFEPPGSEVWELIAEEAEEIGRFWEMPIDLKKK